jgi:hypothetical protein
MVCELGSGTFAGSIYPAVKPKFWSSADEPFSVFECESEERCPGGAPETCGYLLAGRSCQHCTSGHYWTGETCKACTSEEMSAVFFPICPLFVIAAAIIIIYFWDHEPLDQWGSWRNAFAFLGFICLNHYQVLYLIRSANIQFPSDYGSLLQAFSFTDDLVSIFKISCSGYGGFELNIIIRALVPIIVALIAVMVFLGSRGAEQLSKKKLRMETDRTINIYLSLVFTFFNGIAASSMVLFKCVRNPNGMQTLAKDRSVICMEDQWNNMVIIGVLAILTYCIGFGGIFTHVIWRAARDFHLEQFQVRWKFLFIKFRSNVWWWSLVFMAKGLLLNAGFIFLDSGLAQVLWILLICQIYLSMSIVFYPWRHRALNLVDMYAHLAIMFVCSILVWFTRDGAENVEGKSQELNMWAQIISCTVVPIALCVAFHIFKKSQKQDDTKDDEEARQIWSAFVKFVSRDAKEATTFIQGLGEWDQWDLSRVQELINVELLGYVKENSHPRITPRRPSQCSGHEDLSRKMGSVIVMEREQLAELQTKLEAHEKRIRSPLS